MLTSYNRATMYIIQQQMRKHKMHINTWLIKKRVWLVVVAIPKISTLREVRFLASSVSISELHP